MNREFHDTDLSASVAFAFHAIAIDEHRKPFLPTLWEQTPEGGAAGQHLEQTWFPGCHADVGGGNPDSSLSALALDWMASRARMAGLDVTETASPGPPALPTHHPDPLGPIHESQTFLYRLFGSGVREVMPAALTGRSGEEISQAARERWARSNWRPQALVDAVQRQLVSMP